VVDLGSCRLAPELAGRAGDVSKWKFHIPGLWFQERKVAAHPKDAQGPSLFQGR
jgi:hypothetical protein